MARQTLEVGLSGRTGRRGCGHSWRCCPRPPPGRRELGIMAAGSAPCVPSRAAPELSVRVPQSPHCPSRPSWAPPCRLPPRGPDAPPAGQCRLPVRGSGGLPGSPAVCARESPMSERPCERGGRSERTDEEDAAALRTGAGAAREAAPSSPRGAREREVAPAALGLSPRSPGSTAA